MRLDRRRTARPDGVRRTLVFVAAALAHGSNGYAQPAAARPPVIDVHVHSTTVAPTALPRLDSLNVRHLVLSALAGDLEAWDTVEPARYLPSLVFPCAGGRAPITVRPCFGTPGDLPDTLWLRAELHAGRIRGFGEMSPAYLGMSPADPRLDPYWRLATEFDVPVGIHMGFGPPGAAYGSERVPVGSPAFRMALNDPLLLEEVLLRHRGLRLFIMHAGWPRLEPMLALLYAHPHVYVDLAGLQAEAVIPRAEYHRYLQGLVRAGFGDRVMFGSDFPDQLEVGIQAVLTAEFLSEAQKAAILCGNAARFLRLDTAVCAP